MLQEDLRSNTVNRELEVFVVPSEFKKMGEAPLTTIVVNFKTYYVYELKNKSGKGKALEIQQTFNTEIGGKLVPVIQEHNQQIKALNYNEKLVLRLQISNQNKKLAFVVKSLTAEVDEAELHALLSSIMIPETLISQKVMNCKNAFANLNRASNPSYHFQYGLLNSCIGDQMLMSVILDEVAILVNQNPDKALKYLKIMENEVKDPTLTSRIKKITEEAIRTSISGTTNPKTVMHLLQQLEKNSPNKKFRLLLEEKNFRVEDDLNFFEKTPKKISEIRKEEKKTCRHIIKVAKGNKDSELLDETKKTQWFKNIVLSSRKILSFFNEVVKWVKKEKSKNFEDLLEEPESITQIDLFHEIDLFNQFDEIDLSRSIQSKPMPSSSKKPDSDSDIEELDEIMREEFDLADSAPQTMQSTSGSSTVRHDLLFNPSEQTTSHQKSHYIQERVFSSDPRDPVIFEAASFYGNSEDGLSVRSFSFDSTLSGSSISLEEYDLNLQPLDEVSDQAPLLGIIHQFKSTFGTINLKDNKTRNELTEKSLKQLHSLFADKEVSIEQKLGILDEFQRIAEPLLFYQTVWHSNYELRKEFTTIYKRLQILQHLEKIETEIGKVGSSILKDKIDIGIVKFQDQLLLKLGNAEGDTSEILFLENVLKSLYYFQTQVQLPSVPDKVNPLSKIGRESISANQFPEEKVYQNYIKTSKKDPAAHLAKLQEMRHEKGFYESIARANGEKRFIHYYKEIFADTIKSNPGAALSLLLEIQKSETSKTFLSKHLRDLFKDAKENLTANVIHNAKLAANHSPTMVLELLHRIGPLLTKSQKNELEQIVKTLMHYHTTNNTSFTASISTSENPLVKKWLKENPPRVVETVDVIEDVGNDDSESIFSSLSEISLQANRQSHESVKLHPRQTFGEMHSQIGQSIQSRGNLTSRSSLNSQYGRIEIELEQLDSEPSSSSVYLSTHSSSASSPTSSQYTQALQGETSNVNLNNGSSSSNSQPVPISHYEEVTIEHIPFSSESSSNDLNIFFDSLLKDY